jgi:non-ribosomal peptide synthetase component F
MNEQAAARTGNSTREPYGVHELFAAQARRAPAAVAARFATGEELTYGELDARAMRLAARLRAAGVGPETLVAVCFERTAELPVALLAVLRAGGAYLPLEPTQPPARLDALLDDARPALLLTGGRLHHRLRADGISVMCVDELDDVSAPSGLARAEASPHAEQAAYVVYTSGSTGAPKGVVVPHAPLLAHCRAVATAYALSPADRVLQFSSLAFDVAAEELFPTWASGASVVFRSGTGQASVHELVAFLRREAVTVANLPAALWHQWVAELERDAALRPPDSLRLVVAGSEAVLPDRLMAWRRLTGRRPRWLNAYGPSEATITATLFEPGPAEELGAARSRSAGRCRTS